MTTSASEEVAASLKEASADGRGFPMAAGGDSSSHAEFAIVPSSHDADALLLSENPINDDATKLVACEGKQKFQSYMIVNKVLKRMNKSRGAVQNAYRCKHCGFIHIGGRKKRIR